MHKLIPAIFIVIGIQAVCACSSERAYSSLQGARENECQKIVDTPQRNQCLENAHRSYNQFEQQRHESRNQ